MRKPSRPIVITVLILIGLGAIGFTFYRHARPPLTAQPRPLLATEGPRDEPVTPAEARRAAARAQVTDPVVGQVGPRPLDDRRFAVVSARIVIAAMGLKKDADWSANVVAYMDKVLQDESVTPDEYKQYADALQKDPKRATAVTEDIMQRVEKVTGYRMDMRTLAKFDFGGPKLQDVKGIHQRLNKGANR